MSATRRASGRTGPPLNPAELLDHARFIAAEVLAGRYLVEYDQTQRWHRRLYRDHQVELWLISWLPSQGTQLHDHGGSGGAFTVLHGELAEAVYQPPPAWPEVAGPALVERRRPSGSGVGFGPRHVHDVRNLSQAPAASVHAYSPPLSSMTFYDVDQAGSLRRLVSMSTEVPEPAMPGDELGTPAA